MNENKKISLIVPVYKNIEFLDMIFESLKKQSTKNFEFIITEDDNDKEVQKFISKKINECDFQVQHINQEDLGFRRNKALNEALKIAQGNLLVFIDGDCFLHKKFIEEYNKAYNEGDCFIGRRQSLGKNFSREVISKKMTTLNYFKILCSDSPKKEFKESIYLFGFKRVSKYLSLLGSHFAVKKDLLIKINGFDEDYVGYGLEDCDLEWRLRAAGGSFVNMKGRAIQYHLWHEETSRDKVNFNLELYNQKKSIGNWRCKNGLEKL